MSTDARKKAWYACLGAGVMAVVSHPLWVLGTVLMASAIALNY